MHECSKIYPSPLPGWLQVDLLEATHVTGFMIQGRGGVDQYVTSVHFLYSDDSITWHKATKDGDIVSIIFQTDLK